MRNVSGGDHGDAGILRMIGMCIAFFVLSCLVVAPLMMQRQSTSQLMRLMWMDAKHVSISGAIAVLYRSAIR